MKKNKRWLAIPLLLLSMCVLAGEPGVIFLFTNGQKASFTFASKPSIKLGTEALTVTSTDSAAVSYAFADVEYFYFEENIETAIEDVNGEKAAPVFSYHNGVIAISALQAAERVSVYAASGSKVAEAKADESGQTTVDISTAAPGVYVVSTSGGLNFKIKK